MKVDKGKCTGCAYCLLSCPVGAITSDGWATIDTDECTLCGACPAVCPNDAISGDFPIEEPARDYQPAYNVVVVGSGIGGLMTAAALARDGRRVGVFEKLSFIGGRYTEIDYQGYAVTTGAWTSLGSKSNIGEFLEELGVEVDYISLRDKGYDQQFSIRFKDGKDFHSLQAMLSRRDWRAYVRALVRGRKLDLQDASTRDYIEEYVTDDDLMAAVNAIAATASGVDIDRFPASEYIVVASDSAKAALDFAVTVGGVRTLVEGLEGVIRTHGGKIFTRAEVAHILLDGGAAAGIELKNGDQIRADAVVHNGGISRFVKLVGPENLPPEYVEGADKLAPVDCAALILGTTEPLFTEAPILMTPGTDRVVGIFDPTLLDPSVAPPGKHMYDVFLPLHSDDRSEELALALGDLRALFPKVDEVVDMMVPMFFTGSWSGAESGQTFGQVGDQRLDPESPIPNLYLVGMDVKGSGAAGDLIPLGVRELLKYLESGV
jgi:phytoene dehydrogenase-like protein/NAD-dependent dihydropyrimidine dehydrogenase PreA subunit